MYGLTEPSDRMTMTTRMATAQIVRNQLRSSPELNVGRRLTMAPNRSDLCRRPGGHAPCRLGHTNMPDVIVRGSVYSAKFGSRISLPTI